MRDVDVHVMNPAIRCHPTQSVIVQLWEVLGKVGTFALLCAFWGTILFLAITAAVR